MIRMFWLIKAAGMIGMMDYTPGRKQSKTSVWHYLPQETPDGVTI